MAVGWSIWNWFDQPKFSVASRIGDFAFSAAQKAMAWKACEWITALASGNFL
jgi:hypothetical protein